MRALIVLGALAAGALVHAQGTPATQKPPNGPLQADLKAQLVRALEKAASELDGVVGYIVTDLTTNERVAARLEREPFPTASAIKLSILYELLKQSEAGTLPLDAPKPVDRAQLVGGSGVMQHLTTPSLSLRDHATLMIMVSDNSSTNVVIQAVGMDKVNARMATLGLSDIRLRRLMMDAAAVKRGDENVASPASLAKMAELLWRGEGLKPESRETAMGMLKLVSGSIRRGVPSSVPVYAKTGSLDGVISEAGVVDVEGRPFSIAVMTTYLATADEGTRAVRDMAAAAWSYFDRLAKGGAYGRK
ncbi:MAG: serine hydrolase [Vicinamibacterales bacterium]